MEVSIFDSLRKFSESAPLDPIFDRSYIHFAFGSGLVSGRRALYIYAAMKGEIIDSESLHPASNYRGTTSARYNKELIQSFRLSWRHYK